MNSTAPIASSHWRDDRGAPSLTGSPAIWIALTTCGTAAYALGARGVFHSDPGALPIAVLIAALGPSAAFLAVYAISARLRRWVAALDLAELIALQAWRILGFAFLIAWALAALPAVFALPAGLGDIAVGLAAPAAALAVARRSPGWRRGAYTVTIAGLIDFAVAFATGILSREGGILAFTGATPSTLLGNVPLSLFPTFIVPAFLILHIMTLIKLRQDR